MFGGFEVPCDADALALRMVQTASLREDAPGLDELVDHITDEHQSRTGQHYTAAIQVGMHAR